ncbi:uncharacterized protein DS421_16g567350 [Arachis hypogaea]|nr:uncharacterized protein DS421_16g567320 [Arachis hypogaea]QHN88889.1 uncharacterized protein DS421_16g567350 [Arachis hypogaea]
MKRSPNPPNNHFPFLLSQSPLSPVSSTHFSGVTLLLGIEFAVDEEALPPLLQCFAYGSLSPSVSLSLSISVSLLPSLTFFCWLQGILNKSKLVAIDAGNRGYPPNKVWEKMKVRW